MQDEAVKDSILVAVILAAIAAVCKVYHLNGNGGLAQLSTLH